MWPIMTTSSSSSSKRLAALFPGQARWQWAPPRCVVWSFLLSIPEVSDYGSKLVEGPLRSSFAPDTAPHHACATRLVSIAFPIASDEVRQLTPFNELARAKGVF